MGAAFFVHNFVENCFYFCHSPFKPSLYCIKQERRNADVSFLLFYLSSFKPHLGKNRCPLAAVFA
jgi:hypothetical protein